MPNKLYAGAPKKGGSKASPARKAALEVVRTVRERKAFAQEVMAKVIDESTLSPEDRAFATRLALGVVSSSGTLDEVLDRALRAPGDLQPEVRDALRISAYEILFLDKTPHAAVDQGVELVRDVAYKAAGLANAVLRKVVGMKADFPFGDPKRDVAALARLCAFPTWLAKRLITDLGAQAAYDFMRASNEPAPLFIAVNAIKATDNEVRAAFANAGCMLEPEAVMGRVVEGCYRVRDTHALLHNDVRALLSSGKLLVSDAASQAVASLVMPEHKGATLLEVGAGRATKTIMLQSNAQRTWGAQMTLTTLDNHAFKTKLLASRTQHYGVQVAHVATGDALNMDDVLPGAVFDEVFIDAPCTGLGTLRRHPEIRWRITEADIEASAQLQLAMLQAATSAVAPGGTLAYATCSVTHAENNAVVKAFLESDAGRAFKLVPIGGQACFASRLTPGSCDAHFAVRMVRQA